VGDFAFQKKCLGKMENVAKSGRTILFVSHNMAAIRNLCQTAVLIDQGRLANKGDVDEVLEAYLKESSTMSGVVSFQNRNILKERALSFLQVAVVDDSRTPSSLILRSQGVIVEVEYEVFHRLKGVQILIELWDSMGICILTTTNIDKEDHLPQTLIEPGIYRAACFIPPEYLQGGTYYIQLGAVIPKQQWLDKVENAISFEVVDQDSVVVKLGHGRRGVIYPVLDWKVQKIN
jgi:lipopolysaccharide transport system ATP-binding protein